jgi:hypothetical protein
VVRKQVALGIVRQRWRSIDIVAPLARRSTPTSSGAAVRSAGACPKPASSGPFTVRHDRHGSASSPTIPATPGSSSRQKARRAAPSSLANRTTLRLASNGRWARLGASVMILPILVACSSKPPRPAASPSIVATTTTTTQAQLEAVILSQWRAAMSASVIARKDPTAVGLDLQLATYFVDPLLSYLRNQYAARARDGLADTGDLDLGLPHITSISNGTAVVLSCITDHLVLVDKATGKPLPGTNPNPAVEGIRSELALSPSKQWKVSMNTLKVGSCDGF